MDQYEKDWIGLNILDYNNYVWFGHDCEKRLSDLTTLIFDDEETKEVDIPDFNIVPAITALFITMAVGIIIDQMGNEDIDKIKVEK